MRTGVTTKTCALHNADPMTVYLLNDGGEPVVVPGVVDFNLTVENPEVNEEREDPRRVNPRRAQQLRRRRRANPGDLSLNLDYDPCHRVHRELLAAGETDVMITLRFEMNDNVGQPVIAQEVDCSVLRTPSRSADRASAVPTTPTAPTPSTRSCVCSATETSAVGPSRWSADAFPGDPARGCFSRMDSGMPGIDWRGEGRRLIA